MAPTTPSLSTLPSELILAILSHISSPIPLAAFCLANRHLYRLTLPFLYRTFPGRNSELFLRTISHHPQLAAYTKNAVWQQERKTISRIDMLEKQHIINRLNELCVPHGTDLAELFAKFGKNDDYWYMEVLLLFMPNLAHLTIRESWLWDDHHYWFKSLSPYFNPLCHSKLTAATLHGPLRVENIVPLLTIPALKSLELTQVTVMRREGYRVFQWSVWPVSKVLAERSSNLEVLTLRESYVDLRLVNPVMRGVKALKSFTYEHVPNDLADQIANIIRPDAETLAPCLARHASSLEHLRIRDMDPVDWTGIADLLFGSAPGNRDDEHAPSFPTLKTLDIGPIGDMVDWPEVIFEAVTGGKVRSLVERLPLSLQTLRMQVDRDFYVRVGELLKTFAYALSSARRALTVEVVEWDPTLGWFPDNLPLLQKTYHDLGLQLVSIAGDVDDIYGAEPLLTDDESEEGWTIVTDLQLAIM